jgi:hypothetical protein
MTQDEIIRMAREAGVWDEIGYPSCIKRFAALVAEATKEKAAKVCEDEHDKSHFGANGYHCAAAIRSMK